MSSPYGQPPVNPQPGPRPQHGGLGLSGMLGLVAGGLGLVIYLCSFADAAAPISGVLLFLLLGAGLLAAAGTLPNAPSVLVPAAVLSAVGSLGTLLLVVNFGGGFGTSVPGILVFILIVAFLQTASSVTAVLLQAGLIKSSPRPAPHQQQPWGPQPGGFAPPPGQYGQPGYGPPVGYGQHPPPATPYTQPGPYAPPGGQYPPPAHYPQHGQYGAPPQGQPPQPPQPPPGQRPPGEYGNQTSGTTQFLHPGDHGHPPDQGFESDRGASEGHGDRGRG